MSTTTLNPVTSTITFYPTDYAAPLDEHDPDGDVVVYRADGTPVAQMARALWDTLREGATR